MHRVEGTINVPTGVRSPSEGFDLGQVVTGLRVVRGKQVGARSTSSGIGTPTGTLMSTLIRVTLLPRRSQKRRADLLLSYCCHSPQSVPPWAAFYLQKEG